MLLLQKFNDIRGKVLKQKKFSLQPKKKNWGRFSFFHFLKLGFRPILYSMVLNNSAARLSIFKIFSLPTRLIWTYTLIKIQIIFLPTRLLSTIFYFFYLFSMLFAAFFCYNCFNNAFFSCIFILLLVSSL